MAPFTSRDKKKTKRDPSPGSREAGEVIPIVPPGESNKTKKTSPGSPEAGELIPIVPPGESSKTKKTNHYTLDVQTRLRKYVTHVPFQWTQELETWLTSDQFHSWTDDREKWAMGYPTTSELPHQTHRLRLKEALDAMVYLNISSLQDHRKTAEYWAHYFIDQLMVDPTICMRPIESTKRAAKHPSEISRKTSGRIK
ncbi:hypothetical protein R1sor_011745 [Riccia sorocarpa]|uniref:Transposase n=1 Tax=Riccia sorocarpa TaxID=122646 RepID=A0ABD3I7W8_9MARC